MGVAENILGSAREVFEEAGVQFEPVDVDKVTEENPQSRFRVTDNANLAPGVCAVCGSAGGDGRQFVDFAKTVDFYGVFYFCTFCVTEMAAIIGLQRTIQFEEEINTLQNGCVDRDLEIQSLRENLNAARILLRNCHCDPDSTNPTVLDSLETNPEPESDDSTPDESSGIEGLVDIPGFGSDDEPNEKPKRTRRAASGS